MGLRKKFRDFRDWCPQPSDRLSTKLKRYSMPIAAVITTTLILSVSFFAFSSSITSHPLLPIAPIFNAPASATPTLLWKYNTSSVEEGYGASSPVVVNDVVYTSDENNYVYALNATDGAQLWNYLTGGGADSPAVDNGIVYVNTDFTIDAVNATNGAQLWSNEPQYDIPVGFSSPTVVNGVVYAGTTNSLDSRKGNVYAMNAKDGNTLWSTPSFTGFGTVYSSPTVSNGVVYIGVEGAVDEVVLSTTSPYYGVYALGAKSGAQLWNFTTGYSVEDSPVVVGGVIYFVTYEGNFFALNAKNGLQLWNYTTGIPTGNVFNVDSSPDVVGGVVYVGSDDGNVYALNAASGAKLWNYTIGNGTLSTPTIANGVVYVGSSDNNIYALNATNGVELWSYPTSGAVDSPAVVNGVLYVGGGDNVYALKVSSPEAPSSASYPTWIWAIGIAVLVLIIVAAAVVLILKKKLKFGVKNRFASEI